MNLVGVHQANDFRQRCGVVTGDGARVEIRKTIADSLLKDLNSLIQVVEHGGSGMNSFQIVGGDHISQLAHVVDDDNSVHTDGFAVHDLKSLESSDVLVDGAKIGVRTEFRYLDSSSLAQLGEILRETTNSIEKN